MPGSGYGTAGAAGRGAAAATSGVVTQVTVGDLNGDGRPDIIVANKRGVFAFTQE